MIKESSQIYYADPKITITAKKNSYTNNTCRGCCVRAVVWLGTSLPVVLEGGRPAGIITVWDLVLNAEPLLRPAQPGLVIKAVEDPVFLVGVP